MKRFVLILFMLFFSLLLYSQSFDQIKKVKVIPHTSIKNQKYTGTCWDFSGISFIESELLRQTGKKYNLSEAYFMYYSYVEKAIDYVRWHGKMIFDWGGSPIDVIHLAQKYGIVRENDYPFTIYDSKPMIRKLHAYLDSIVKLKKISQNWMDGYKKILNKYLGTPPEYVYYRNKKYTPKEFMQNVLKFDPSQYIQITSFPFLPLYKPSIIPLIYNWDKTISWNVTFSEFKTIIDTALNSGYSISALMDISEPGFNTYRSVVKLSRYKNSKMKADPWKFRQTEYDTYQTTDDHVMHVIGYGKDKSGNLFYLLKNSWGKRGDGQGYLFIREPYFEAKTISFLVNINAIPQEIRNKLCLNCVKP